MIQPLLEEMRDLLGLPAEAADPSLLPLIVSLREAISGMSSIDITGVEPLSNLSFPRGWSGVGV